MDNLSTPTTQLALDNDISQLLVVRRINKKQIQTLQSKLFSELYENDSDRRIQLGGIKMEITIA